MKRALLLFFVSLSLSAIAQENMLTNPGFETGSKEGWAGTGPEFQTDEVFQGQYAAMLGKEKGLNQELSLALGQSYEFAFFAKMAKEDGNCLVSIQYNDGSWHHSNSVFVNDTVWQEYKLRIKAQEREVIKSRIVFWNLTKVNCYIDSVSFYPIDTTGLCHDALILETPAGTLDSTNFTISDMPIGSIKWNNYKENVVLSKNASIQIFEKSSGKTYQDANKLSDAQYLVVVAEDGTVQEYQMEFADYWLKSVKEGTLDNENLKIIGVDAKKTVLEFKYTLRTYDGITCTVLDSLNGAPVTEGDHKLISSDMVVRVDGANRQSFYSLELTSFSQSNITELIGSAIGKLNLENALIDSIPQNTYAFQLSAGLKVLPVSNYELMNADTTRCALDAVIDGSQFVMVTAEDGTQKKFSLKVGNDKNDVVSFNYLSDDELHEHYYQNKTLIVKGQAALHLYEDEKEKVLDGSTVILDSDDAWLYMYGIFPQDAHDYLLSKINIKGQVAEHNVNCRVVQFKEGCVIIPHSPDYRGLEVFSDIAQTGESMTMLNYLYYRDSDLGTLNNNISSFILKHGYMATFATEPNGRGTSKVYVAADYDRKINLPESLKGKVSFVRVFPWRWPSKKGWCGGGKTQPGKLNCTWSYDWNNAASSSLNIEYVPMRHNAGWNKYENINYKKDVTHVLGFNEPDRPDQANMSVDKAISLWPNLLESGLRLGSPSPSDGGLNWLFSFMTKCKNKGYRVDFVAMHYYIGCGSGQDFANRCKYVASKTGKPIWVTEWNNGANWTGCKPTYEEQATKIRNFVDKVDKTDVVERYAIYNWVGATRAMFKDGGLSLAGEEYKSNSAPMAYNPNKINYMANAVSDPTASLDELASEDLDKIWIYPNPTNQPLINVMGLDGEEYVEVYTLQGRLVKRVLTYCDVDVSDMKPGMYIVKVQGEAGVKLLVK